MKPFIRRHEEIPGETFLGAKIITKRRPRFVADRRRIKKLPTKRKPRRTRKPLGKRKKIRDRKFNPWLIHVKKTRTENPDVPYKDILTLAKLTYKRPVKEPIKKIYRLPEDRVISMPIRPIEQEIKKGGRRRFY